MYSSTRQMYQRSSKWPQRVRMFWCSQCDWILISSRNWSIRQLDFMELLLIFFRATRKFVCLWIAWQTVPNLPCPSSRPRTKSWTHSLGLTGLADWLVAMICLMSLMSLASFCGSVFLRETVGEQFSMKEELVYFCLMSLELRQLYCESSLACTFGVLLWKACLALCLLTLGVQYAKPSFESPGRAVLGSSFLLYTILLSIFSLSSWKVSGLESLMRLDCSFLLEYPFSKSSRIFSESLNSCSSFSSRSIFSLWSIFCMILSQLLSPPSGLLASRDCDHSFLEV